MATAGSIAKLPIKKVATMPPAPQISSMMLRVLRRNHREKTLMAPIERSMANTTNHATGLGESPALDAEGCSSNHGKHRPAEMRIHITDETTPQVPFESTLDAENSWLELKLLVGLALDDASAGPAMIQYQPNTQLEYSAVESNEWRETIKVTAQTTLTLTTRLEPIVSTYSSYTERFGQFSGSALLSVWGCCDLSSRSRRSYIRCTHDVVVGEP